MMMEDNKLKKLLDELEELASAYIDGYFSHNNITPIPRDVMGEARIGKYSFNIGNIEIKNPVISAPLAGISDNTYRIFARSFGCSLTFSEMVTSYGLHYDHKKSSELTNITDPERPCALQLFGSDPGIMAEAAAKVAEKADIIDINMGCPVPKIIKAKSGGYLMQEEKLAGKIISRVVDAVDKPVTVKTRIGWNRDNINAVNMAMIARESGASAIIIHGRTVKQGFSGEVDYGEIRKVKDAVDIPVIASGDILNPADALNVLEYTKCEGVMIGRAAKGTLWIFMEMVTTFLLMEKGYDIGYIPEGDPGKDWKKRFAALYLRFLVHFKGEYKAVREFRKHLSWIFKGERDIAKTRKKFFLIEGIGDALEIIDSISKFL
jgi:tRNA-dihydrouridine synthase B